MNLKILANIFLFAFIGVNNFSYAQTSDSSKVFCEIYKIMTEHEHNNFIVLIKNKGKDKLCLYLSQLLDYSNEHFNSAISETGFVEDSIISISISHKGNEVNGSPMIIKCLESGDVFIYKFYLPATYSNLYKRKEFSFMYTFDIRKKAQFTYQLKYLPYSIFKLKFD